MGGSDQGVCSLVFFPPSKGLYLHPRCPLLGDQVPDVGRYHGTCSPAQGGVEYGKVLDQHGVTVLQQHGTGEGGCGISHEQVGEGFGHGVD